MEGSDIRRDNGRGLVGGEVVIERWDSRWNSKWNSGGGDLGGQVRDSEVKISE